MSTPRVRAERVEVQRSRDLILAAAEAHYSFKDADPTMSELAVLAGVGSATLYRRYPTIDAVIAELYNRLWGEMESIAEDVLRQTTSWDAIVALVMGIIDTLQEHPALPRLNRKMVSRDDEHRFGGQWEAQLDQLISQAQADGALRGDVNANDITFAAFRIGSYSNLPPDDRDRVIGRQVGIVLDGLRADRHASALPGGPISPDDLHQIFRYEVTHPVE